MKIYFAHPVSDYNTSKETNDIEIIKSNFPNFEILNPNSSENEVAYKQLGMSHFESLVKTCDAIVCVPFSDGEWVFGKKLMLWLKKVARFTNYSKVS